MSAVPRIATTLEVFAHMVVLPSTGRSALLTSQRMLVLQAMPHNVVSAKRASSFPVVRCRCLKAPVLIQKKAVDRAYAIGQRAECQECDGAVCLKNP